MRNRERDGVPIARPEPARCHDDEERCYPRMPGPVTGRRNFAASVAFSSSIFYEQVAAQSSDGRAPRTFRWRPNDQLSGGVARAWPELPQRMQVASSLVISSATAC